MALVWMVCREQFFVATRTGHSVVFQWRIVLHKGERIEQEMALVWMVCRGKFSYHGDRPLSGFQWRIVLHKGEIYLVHG
jgi:hypothetical protein